MKRLRARVDLEECYSNVKQIKVWTEQQPCSETAREAFRQGELNTQQQNFETQKRDFEQRLIGYSDRNIELQKHADEMQLQQSSLQARCHEVEVQLSSKGIELLHLQQILLSSHKELVLVQTSLSSSSSQCQKLNELLHALSVENRNMEKQRTAIDSSWQTAIQELQRKHDLLRTRCHETELQLRSCETRNDELTKRGQEHQSNEKQMLLVSNNELVFPHM
jgi:hypothetical protein